MASEFVAGQQRGWRLVDKLGSGDAGEVYRVESVTDHRVGVLKRPQKSAFTGQVSRQAGQIEREGRILRLLAAAELRSPYYQVCTPALLDTSKPGTEFSERYFIIIEPASGFDLLSLGRLSRVGSGALPASPLEAREHAWLERIAQRGDLPEPLLLRLLSATMEFLKRIHSLQPANLDDDPKGILWNDIKPEHIFWEPRSGRVTLIDWGNGQMLEADGATHDRQFSIIDDYAQFLEAFGRFLVEFQPSLAARLDWPSGQTRSAFSANSGWFNTHIHPVQQRIADALKDALASLQQSRLDESDLLIAEQPELLDLDQLEVIQAQIASAGELPDAEGALGLYNRLAGNLATMADLEGFRQVCSRAKRLPDSDPDHWDLLAKISEQANSLPAEALQAILAAGLAGDWAAAHWELARAAPVQAENHQAGLQEAARRLAIQSDLLPPLVAANRLLHTLHASAQKAQADVDAQIQALIRELREEIIPRWQHPEPDPPYSGIAYTEVEEFLTRIGLVVPEAGKELQRLLNQPLAQVKVALDSWARQDFATTRRSLRVLFAWDPARRRLFHVDSLLSVSSHWLERIRQGPRAGQRLDDFVARFELQSRELRNTISPAPWLDRIVEALSSLRRGVSPVDVLLDNPSLRETLPWLSEMAAQPVSAEGPGKPVLLERMPYTLRTEGLIQGEREGRLGEDGDLVLSEALDNWVPEARGSSARVFAGFLRLPADTIRSVAVKLLRAERMEYALPLFHEEALVLSILRDIPGVIGLLEGGFIYPNDQARLPDERSGSAAREFSGRIRRYGPGKVPDFLGALEREAHAGAIPYLALEKLDRQDNLLLLCDAGYRRGRFLPIQETLRMAIQICDILRMAHARNIVYRDHKILHYYWLEEFNGVQLLDWNIARLHREGLSATDRTFDLVQFAARGLHHILTGRAAPGALPLGPNRPEDIEAAATSYSAQWTYDDNRIPSDVRTVIEKALSGSYSQAGDLKNDLLACFQRLAALNLPGPDDPDGKAGGKSA